MRGQFAASPWYMMAFSATVVPHMNEDEREEFRGAIERMHDAEPDQSSLRAVMLLAFLSTVGGGERLASWVASRPDKAWERLGLYWQFGSNLDVLAGLADEASFVREARAADRQGVHAVRSAAVVGGDRMARARPGARCGARRRNEGRCRCPGACARPGRGAGGGAAHARGSARLEGPGDRGGVACGASAARGRRLGSGRHGPGKAGGRRARAPAHDAPQRPPARPRGGLVASDAGAGRLVAAGDPGRHRGDVAGARPCRAARGAACGVRGGEGFQAARLAVGRGAAADQDRGQAAPTAEIEASSPR